MYEQVYRVKLSSNTYFMHSDNNSEEKSLVRIKDLYILVHQTLEE